MFDNYYSYHLKIKSVIINVIDQEDEVYCELRDSYQEYVSRLANAYSDDLEPEEFINSLNNVEHGDRYEGAIFNYKFVLENMK